MDFGENLKTDLEKNLNEGKARFSIALQGRDK